LLNLILSYLYCTFCKWSHYKRRQMRKKLSFACFRDSVKWPCLSCSTDTQTDGTQVGMRQGYRKQPICGGASRQRHTCPSLHGCEQGWPMSSSVLHSASHIALTVNTFKSTDHLDIDLKYITCNTFTV